MKTILKTLLSLTLFSIAMSYLETSVVVYLRKIYYPNGFTFPLTPIEPPIATIEFWREAATIVMLAGIGILAGRNKTERFAFFIYCFAIWDIFYYIFLKLLLDWPATLFTWDILFLIPVPWVGPVITPCILSITMILLASMIVYFTEKGYKVRIKWREWMLFITGSLILLLSFTQDYLRYVQNNGGLSTLWTLSRHESLFTEAPQYVPVHFNWWIFCIGEFLLLLAIGWLSRRLNSEQVKGERIKSKNLLSAH